MLTVNTPAAPRTRLPLGLTRLNWVLVGLLILQIVLLAIVLWPRSNEDVSGAHLLGGLTAADINAIKVADSDGHTVGVERSGEGWTISGTDGYTATVTKVDETIQKLLAIKTNSLVTRTPSSHRQLQVTDDAFTRRITVTGPDGDHIIFIGAPGGGNAYHVRLQGEDSTWLASAVAPYELETAAGSWVDAQYFNVPKEEITAVSLINATGAISLTHKDDGSWTLDNLAAGEQVDAAKVDAFLSQVATVMLSSPLGKTPAPEFGMDKPLATVELTTRSQDGAVTSNTLQLGAKDDADGVYYFKASTSPWYVTVAGPTGDALAQKQHADFLTPPATTTPAAESGALEQLPALVSPLPSPHATTPVPSE